MAHQAHNIPWTFLSSSLSWCLTNSCKTDATDLHFRFRPDQGKKLTYFANAFARNIIEHGSCERKKFPEYDVSDQDEVVIPDHVAEKIAPTVQRWRRRSPNLYADGFRRGGYEDRILKPNPCSHVEEPCLCAVPYSTRKMKAFLRRHHPNNCYRFYEENGAAFFNVAVFETLLLYGEMDAIFRICSHPSKSLETWWRRRECYDVPDNLGWKFVSQLALDAYIMLNTIHNFLENRVVSSVEQRDYRRMKSYQSLVYYVTNDTWPGPTTYPHRQFFGTRSNQFEGILSHKSKLWSHIGNIFGKQASPLGHLPYEAFLMNENTVGYKASLQDVSHVRWILCEQGLPVEIANEILDIASYTGERRLTVPHDPFHQQNQEELAKYLKYCWQLIVRTETIGRALGMWIDWETEVSLSIVRLFDCGCSTYKAPKLYQIDVELLHGFGGFL